MAVVAGRVNSVDHAFRLMALLASSPEALTVSMLAAQLNLPRPTVYRLLGTLQEHQVVARSGHRYRLTLRLLELGESVLEATKVQSLCLPFLTALMEQTGETTHFVILDGSKAGYVAKVDGTHPIRMASRVGWRGPLHATAAGKVLLAWSGPELLAQTCAGELEHYTHATITDPGLLAAEVAAVRARGFATDQGELLDGLVCIAAPVLSGRRLFGAVSVSGPALRVQDIDSVSAVVRQTAAGIAARL